MSQIRKITQIIRAEKLMKVKILFDKETIDKKLFTGWGVSVLVDGRVLFDTGEKGEWLLGNMKLMSVGLGALEAVVISHNHWDHTGGLRRLLAEKKGLKVYICSGFNEEFKNEVRKMRGRLIEADTFVEVTRDIFITGRISGVYKNMPTPEEALVVKTRNGLTVITGCSHPGILKILGKIHEQFPQDKINFVFGGFHLIDKGRREIRFIIDKFKEMGVKKVGPSHCSGYEAQSIFKEAYGDSFISIKVGREFNI